MAFSPKCVGQIALAVATLDGAKVFYRAEVFYRGALGLRPSYRFVI